MSHSLCLQKSFAAVLEFGNSVKLMSYSGLQVSGSIVDNGFFPSQCNGWKDRAEKRGGER